MPRRYRKRQWRNRRRRQGMGARGRSIRGHCGPYTPRPETVARADRANSVEDSRGAGALMNTARIGRTLNWMSEENAKEASVDVRRLYFRADNGQANLGPPETTTWFKLVPVHLAYGDDVAVVTPWTFPGPLEGVTAEQMHRVPTTRTARRRSQSSPTAQFVRC